MSDRPPKEWYDKTSSKVKKSLTDSNPGWSSDTIESQSRQTVGDLWYNKMSKEKRAEIIAKYTSDADAERKADAEYEKSCMSYEKAMADSARLQEALLNDAEADLSEPPETREKPIHDELNRSEASSNNKINIPMFKFNYTAAPKPGFAGEDGPIIIKSLVLEEGPNLNKWRVLAKDFQSVADQFKAGRHLRINHSKDMENVIGKSFDGKVIRGEDVEGYLGQKVEGINPNGKFVAVEFEATPRDPQVRTNILKGYVQTGSIGLDAEAFCDECNKQLTRGSNGEMEKTCRHADSVVHLERPDVKEYSYVAEPAFEHTNAYPSFSAASDFRLIKESSLSLSKESEKVVMPEEIKKETIVEATAAKAAKADSESEGDADAAAEALAAKYMSYYKKGRADAESEAKAKADGDSDDDKQKVKASAAVEEPKTLPLTKPKTDQIGRTVAEKSVSKQPGEELTYENLMNPTMRMLNNGSMAALLFKAAADPSKSKGVPREIANKFKGMYE